MLKVNRKRQITATVNLAKAGKTQIGKVKPLRYASSAPSIATVSKTGVIKGISKGACRIYVYAVNGKSAKIRVTVK